MNNNEIGFKTYTWKELPMTPVELKDWEAQKIYTLNATYIYKKAPPPDTRSKYRKFVDDWKKRFSHAWYALKGGECD